MAASTQPPGVMWEAHLLASAITCSVAICSFVYALHLQQTLHLAELQRSQLVIHWAGTILYRT